MTTLRLGRRPFSFGLAGAAALGFPALAQAQGEPIRVGVIVPLSGPAGPNGQGVLHAVQVAAEMINAKGGVLGRKIAVTTRARRRSASRAPTRWWPRRSPWSSRAGTAR